MNVAIVGGGDVANRYHLPLWKRSHEVNVVAVCDTNGAAAQSLAERWNIPQTYTDFSTCLAEQPSGSIIDICTPPGTHLSFVKAAMEAGCHVLLEKPMTMTIDETEGILRAYSERRNKELQLGVCYIHMFDPLIVELRSMSRKCIGEVLGVELNRLFPPHEHMIANPEHWCHKLPGGRFGEDLVHAVYLLQSFLGDLEVESLWTSKRGPHPWVPRDELHVTFSAGKAFGKVYSSFNSVRPATYITVYGTEGVLWHQGATILRDSPLPENTFGRSIRAIKRPLQAAKPVLKGSLRVARVLPRMKDGREVLFRSFIDSVLDKTDFPLTVQDACGASRTFLRILQEIEHQ